MKNSKKWKEFLEWWSNYKNEVSESESSAKVCGDISFKIYTLKQSTYCCKCHREHIDEKC